MAAISPFNFLAAFEKSQAPELISPEQTMPAFEDALASMLGSQAPCANDGGVTSPGGATSPGVAAEPRLGLPPGAGPKLDPAIADPARDAPLGDGASDGGRSVDPQALVGSSPHDAPISEESPDDEPADESLLVNPQACFVTLPWSPPTDRESFPAIGAAHAPTTARGHSALPSDGVPLDPPVVTAQAPASVRRSTLRFPPPPEAMAQAAREIAFPNLVPSSRATHSGEGEARPSKKPDHEPQKAASAAPALNDAPLLVTPLVTAPPVTAPQNAAPRNAAALHADPQGAAPRDAGPPSAGPLHAASHNAARPVAPGFMVAPTAIEGARIEWTIEAPSAPANDTHRSMSYAVAAAENEQRTVHTDARSHARRERGASATTPVDARDAREPEERSRVIEPSAEVPRASELFTSPTPESPTFMAHAAAPRPDTGFERMAASVAALPDHRLDSGDLRSHEASRARRQDDAEVTVSEMTLSHRVEARTVVEDLGAISVRADARHGHVEVSVTADRAETAVLIDQNRLDLTRDLKLAAPTVSDVSVRTGDTGGGSAAFDQRSSSGREQQRERHAPDDWAAGTPSSMAAASVVRAPLASAKRVRIVL